MHLSFIKPLCDFLIALVALVLLSPLFLLVMILLAVVNKGNPFFTQLRPGKMAKIYKIIKFKTMTNERDTSGKLLPDKERITKVGKFIRSTSLDELPQLINVIKGDMSLVGPRPLLVKYLSIYTPEQARRHEVRPGITGWAQVTGRNSLSWEEKFMRDVWYVDNISFALDVKILWFTVIRVFKREGINQQGQATMELFKGSIHSK